MTVVVAVIMKIMMIATTNGNKGVPTSHVNWHDTKMSVDLGLGY